MLSLKSVKNFLYINGIMVVIGGIQYSVALNTRHWYTHVLSVFLNFLCRNYLLVHFIDYKLQDKDSIYVNESLPVETYKNEFQYTVMLSSSVEALTYVLIQNSMPIWVSRAWTKDLLFFIPMSFILELIFDFFHYWTHRISHTNKFLYKYSHKTHHKFKHPTPILTFYHNPLDLMITNAIPQSITLVLIQRLCLFLPCISFLQISLFQFHLFLVYKTFIEISGHSGKKLYPRGSFPQFIWLPNLLRISLFTEDHHLHHNKSNCNYSKRFSLWDKVFGTYEKKKEQIFFLTDRFKEEQ